MVELLIFFYFIFGLVIGSYLNVAVYRIPLKISTAEGRSFCPRCHHQLSALDLVPVLSWMFLKGRCRYCHEPISPRYPLIELCTGMLFALACITEGPGFISVLNCLFFSVLIVTALIDLDTMEIPDRLHLIIFLLGFIRLVLTPANFGSQLLGALIISIPFWIFYHFEAMGGGDVKLMLVSGFYLGFSQVLVSFVLSTFLGAAAALYLIGVKKKDRRTAIPFGPFLAMGMVLAVLIGPDLLQFYLSFF